MIFAHVFRCDGFRSMVLDALACINIYSNIERMEDRRALEEWLAQLMELEEDIFLAGFHQ